jgi:hypothetical protein
MSGPAARRGSPSGLAAAAQLVDPDGSVRHEALSADAQVAWYSRIVHSGQDGLVEVVRATRQADGQLRMRSRRDPRHYLDAGDAYALCRLAGMARGRGEEVFCTPLPRESAEPGKRAVVAGSVVWVDLDGADGNGLREIGRLKPHLWVASGAGQHLYWRLADELPPAEVEELNRRLCHRLGGDPACCEYGRIMRMPGTFNQRRGQWCRIVRADRSRAPVDPDAILGQRSPTRSRRAPFRQTAAQGMAAPSPTTKSSRSRRPPTSWRCVGCGCPRAAAWSSARCQTTTTPTPHARCTARPSRAGGASAARGVGGSTTSPL